MTIALSLLLAALPAQADTACTALPVLSVSSGLTIEETASGPFIPLDGLTLKGIEPDEIDVASACVPTLSLGPIVVYGIEPDEIDNALHSSGVLDLAFGSGETATSTGHILLGRQGDPHGRSSTEETVAGSLVLAPVAGQLTEAVSRTGAVSRTLTLTFELVEAVPDTSAPDLEIHTVLLQTDARFEAGDGLSPGAAESGVLVGPVEEPPPVVPHKRGGHAQDQQDHRQRPFPLGLLGGNRPDQRRDQHRADQPADEEVGAHRGGLHGHGLMPPLRRCPGHR